MRWLILAHLVASVARAQDWERAALPLQFAQASPALAEQFRRDWKVASSSGREWAYCVTAWHTATTSDGDTVFVADRAQMIRTGELTHVGEFECVDSESRPLPLAHAHLTGDCSPSRADIRHVIARSTFGLIVCGPQSVVGYVFSVYALAIEGQETRRSRSP